MVAHACNSSTSEKKVETQRLEEAQGHPWVLTEFSVNKNVTQGNIKFNYNLVSWIRYWNINLKGIKFKETGIKYRH